MSAYDSSMLYGRAAEAAVVERLVEDARSSHSGALVVRGEPGVGKSALLEHAVERGEGMRVLRSQGIQAESELPFAGLHELVRPILDRLPDLPGPQVDALGGALGLTASNGHDRFLVGVGVLGLLAEAAEDAPLLCVVDDAHWLDQGSADALSFVGRRLEAEGIALLFAARQDASGVFEARGLPELRLGGLAGDAAAELLGSGSGVADHVRDRLVEVTGGNPLALLESLEALTPDQLAGRAALPDPLPIGSNVERRFLERVRALPADAQALLLVAAADDTGDPVTLARAAHVLGLDLAGLEPAEVAGLVRVDNRRVSFRHPIMRSAVYGAAPFARRQEAHEALAAACAEVGQTDRRAWHLAAARIMPDAEVASELEQAAERARDRGAHAAAAAALERAAELTAMERDRQRRLLAAADAAWLGGHPERAVAILERVGSAVSETPLRAEAERLRGTIELRRGSPSQAYEILVGASQLFAEDDPAAATATLVTAIEAAFVESDPERLIDAGRRASALPASGDPGNELCSRVASGLSSMLTGDFERGRPLLQEAVVAARSTQDPRQLLFGGFAAMQLGDDATARTLYRQAVAATRELGQLAMLAPALQVLCAVEMLTGRYASTLADASEGLSLARETGQPNVACALLGITAWVEAIQGREHESRAHAAETLEVALTRRLLPPASFAHWALGLIELGAGRGEEALARLAQIQHPLAVLFSSGDYVEAAVRAGDLEAARSRLALLETLARDVGAPWALAAAARCRGLLDSGPDAERHFTEALTLLEAVDRPLERARTELLYGEYLRRVRRRTEARARLRSAYEAFERLGALGWAERAHRELRTTGEIVRKRDPSALGDLTPQELQIARFVAGGATNKEVAAQLFLSKRTIDYHLRKIFAKLDITSRSDLVRLAAGDGLESAS
jgi:DNA-binding CsgD family transcriptional regulator